jgi:hypothetical protein
MLCNKNAIIALFICYFYYQLLYSKQFGVRRVRQLLDPIHSQ